MFFDAFSMTFLSTLLTLDSILNIVNLNDPIA